MSNLETDSIVESNAASSAHYAAVAAANSGDPRPDATPTIEDLVDIAVFRSDNDGAICVEIDTQQDTGDVRVRLNDAVLFNGDPESRTTDAHLLGVIAAAWTAATQRPTVGAQALDLHGQVGKILRDAGRIS